MYTGPSGMAGLVIAYERAGGGAKAGDRLTQAGIPYDARTYDACIVIQPAALAEVRSRMGPSWPLTDAELLPGIVACIPYPIEPETAQESPGPQPERQLIEDIAALMVCGTSRESLLREINAMIEDNNQMAARLKGPQPEQVQVTRIVQYTGSRQAVEEQVSRSLHGARLGPGNVRIDAVSIDVFPKILDEAHKLPPESFISRNSEEWLQKCLLALRAIADSGDNTDDAPDAMREIAKEALGG